MQGIEFVQDRRSKAYAVALRDRVVKNCVFKQHLWVLGTGRSAIRLLPALTTTEDEALEAIDRFVRAIEEEVVASEASLASVRAGE
jgi:4-aminobutyrate aminotransferase